MPGSAPIMPARSRSGARSRSTAMPMPQFNLGQAYRLGRGVPIDLRMAKIWFEKAADSGHLDAQTTLGLLLFQNGDQVERPQMAEAGRRTGRAARAARLRHRAL